MVYVTKHEFTVTLTMYLKQKKTSLTNDFVTRRESDTQPRPFDLRLWICFNVVSVDLLQSSADRLPGIASHGQTARNNGGQASTYGHCMVTALVTFALVVCSNLHVYIVNEQFRTFTRQDMEDGIYIVTTV